MKPNSTKSTNLDGKAGVLHGAHMGGHSDVANMQTKFTEKPFYKSEKKQQEVRVDTAKLLGKAIRDGFAKQADNAKK
jgi:hypothetical protein